MTYLLHIDSAVATASVCLSDGAVPLREKSNPHQKDHAAWLHTAIAELLAEAGIQLADLQAISVSAGPGSYTGLRVGMATAKGLCYALKKPLIAINTLEMMTAAVPANEAGLRCPLIDARRMEVFTAVYDSSGNTVLPPASMILTENKFSAMLDSQPVLFFGNGAPKSQPVLAHPNARFLQVDASAKHLSGLAFSRFEKQLFDDLAYTEPFYGKEFYLPGVKGAL